MKGRGNLVAVSAPAAAATDDLMRELVAHFREQRDTLRREWVEQMKAKGLLAGLTPAETETESVTIYDTCVGCLETGKYDGAQAYATRMAERGVLRGMTPEQILGGLLTLRDVYGRSLFHRYHRDIARLSAALDIYEPVANKILAIVALAFIEEREKVVREEREKLVRQQQEAIRELSTPALRVRERLLILPIIGVLDSHRARLLTEHLLRAIRANRAKVVVMDITGVPNVDSKVANHLVQTVDACRLLGATVIVTGVAPEIAQTLTAIGVDLGRIITVCDLQGGIDEADRLLGYRVIATDPGGPSFQAARAQEG
ncbi:MAG: STAS domain-containing protein [Acidobacteriia bacterium]|nr:STAS domain-containing protein [Terriglobia bacterium]